MGYSEVTMIAYSIAMVITSVMGVLMERGQPALLYSVPSCIAAPCFLAYKRNELGKLVNFRAGGITQIEKSELGSIQNTLAKWAFYPTLLYGLLRNRLSSSFAWYTRIDDNVILGALPFKSMLKELVEDNNVGGVVCLNQPHEVEHDWVAKKCDFELWGVKYYWLPIRDFFYAPSIIDLEYAIQFIRDVKKSGKTVYVHCKAGIGRSATVVAAYLMDVRDLSCDEAVHEIKRLRPHVSLRGAKLRCLRDYERELRRIRELVVFGPA